MTDTRKWSALAVVLVAAIFAASWFLLISPKRGEAAELEQQAVSRADANARLEQQIQVLKAQQADLPRQRARAGHAAPPDPGQPGAAVPDPRPHDRRPQGRGQHRLDGTGGPGGAGRAGSGRAAGGTSRRGHRRRSGHRRRAGTDAAAAPTTRRSGGAAGPDADAVPGAAHGERDRDLLRARAVPQQGRELPTLVPGQRVHPRAGRLRCHGGQHAPDSLTIALTGRVFLSQPAAAAPTTTALAAPATTTGQ